MTNLAVLDNPAWNSLVAGHRAIAETNGMAARFPVEMSPFIGLERYVPEAFGQLATLVPANDVVGLVSVDPVEVPANWELVGEVQCFQMVCVAPPPAPAIVPVLLTDADVPAMVDLALATEPGPFRAGRSAWGATMGSRLTMDG